MSSQVNTLFSDPKFLTTYLFGLVIIVLYAKDKFNMPTYDRAAMGPFAQLPPQSLTMDQRYRHGRNIYIFMLLCLYTAVCVVGPSTFPDLFNLFKNAAPQYQLGPQASSNEMWPVAAATFLISTGAANDGSILGKVEYFVRQYAHKTAYIPRTVRDLARYFREINGYQWLTGPERQEECDERRRRLVQLAGEGAVKEIEQKKGEVSGELLRWIRANILFYTLQSLFRKSVDTGGGRLDELTDQPANKETFASLAGTRQDLYAKLVDAKGEFESGKEETARFAKDVSLMLAVMLSQGARNQTELEDDIKRLDLAEIHFHPSDSSGFVTEVNVGLLVGVIVASAIFLVGYQTPFLRPFVDLTGAGASKDLSDLAQAVDIFPWLATMINATLAYLVAFRVLVYCRDSAMESREWSEDFASRFRVILIASAVSSILSVIASVLFFVIIGKLSVLIPGPANLLYLLLFQFLLSLMLSSFGLAYLRDAPRLLFASQISTRLPILDRLLACMKNPLPWLHAMLAAVLVAILSQLAAVNSRNGTLEFVTGQFSQAADGLLTNQRWIKNNLISQTLPAEKSDDARTKAANDADTRIKSMFAELQRTSCGPIRDLDQSAESDDKILPNCVKQERHYSTFTNDSLRIMGKICGDLNSIRLTDPPDPSEKPPDCSVKTPIPAAKQTAENKAPPEQGKLPIPSNVPVGQDKSSAPPGGAPPLVSNAEPPSLPFTLFRSAETCTPYVRRGRSCEEEQFVGMGRALSGYYRSLQVFENSYRSNKYYAGTVIPALTALLVAYSFGVGCLFFRAGWLREGLAEPQGKKLIEEIKKHYGLGDGAVEVALAQPLKAVGGLTPLEALRYEEFSIKLFDIIKDEKNRVEEFLHIKDVDASEDKNGGATQDRSTADGGVPGDGDRTAR